MSTRLSDLIAWSADEARRFRLRDALAEGVIDRVHCGLGGSHTVVTYPPLDSLRPIASDEIAKAVRPTRGLHLYAHVAFCEHLCPFCHYAKTYSPLGSEDDFLRSYLDALHIEMERWADILDGSTVSSIYVGGGTPTAVSLPSLLRILDDFCRFPRESGFGACVETSPLTTVAAGGRDKLAALAAAGVNRFSIGVQTFDEKLLSRFRGHGLYEAREAVAALLDLGVEFNVDMIQDLPQQTDESLLHDLNWINELRPHQVTWYVLRVHPESPWYRMFIRGDLELPKSADSARRRLMIREGMRRLGYFPRAGGRFVRDAELQDRYKEVRASADPTLLGMGVSAYSHGWGYFFRNSSSGPKDAGIPGYVEMIRRGGLAVTSGRRIDALEQAAGRVVAGIRTGAQLPRPDSSTDAYGREADIVLRRLQHAGLVDEHPAAGWVLTEAGSLFEEEICSLFYSEPTKRLLEESGGYWASPQGGGLRPVGVEAGQREHPEVLVPLGRTRMGARS